MDEVLWLKTILYIKLDKLWNKVASKLVKIIMIIKELHVSSCVLHDYTPLCWSVGWLVGFYFFELFKQTAPAQIP